MGIITNHEYNDDTCVNCGYWSERRSCVNYCITCGRVYRAGFWTGMSIGVIASFGFSCGYLIYLSGGLW